MTALENARDALAGIPGVVSCKVGIEPNLSPADYPMIRVVPSRVTTGKPYSGSTIETLIYFGAQLTTSEGLESVYSALSDMHDEIKAVIGTLQGRYIELVTDEDRLDAYKIMYVRCELASPDSPQVKCAAWASTIAETLSGTPNVLAPFTKELQSNSDLDWDITLANGTVERLLNGASSSKTRLTLTGNIAGTAASEAEIGIYAAGVLIGNRTLVITAGAAVPVAFSISAEHTSLTDVVFDVRATGTAGGYTFSDIRLTAQRA